MRLQHYQFTVKYKRGPTVHLADTLSRAAFSQPVAAQVTNLDVFRIEVESEYNTRNPRLTETTENQFHGETSKDATIATLYKVIVSGWSDDKAAIPESLRPYWNYRDELSVQNDIICKGIQFMHKEMPTTSGWIRTYVSHAEFYFGQERESPFKTCVMLVAPAPNMANPHQKNR